MWRREVLAGSHSKFARRLSFKQMRDDEAIEQGRFTEKM